MSLVKNLTVGSGYESLLCSSNAKFRSPKEHRDTRNTPLAWKILVTTYTIHVKKRIDMMQHDPIFWPQTFLVSNSVAALLKSEIGISFQKWTQSYGGKEWVHKWTGRTHAVLFKPGPVLCIWFRYLTAWSLTACVNDLSIENDKNDIEQISFGIKQWLLLTSGSSSFTGGKKSW